MSDMAIPFRTVIDVVKAVEEDGKKYLLGESSGPEIDLEEQFMSKSCIEDMAEQINVKPVPYLNEHSGRKVGDQLGDVIKASVTPEWHLRTKTLLDPVNPIAMMLWDKVRQGKQYGQSVAGHALAYAKKSVAGKVLKGFDRIRLNHVANTTRPTWQHGLGSMIAKSQDWGDIKWEDVDEYEGDIPFLEAEPVGKAVAPDKKTSKVKADKKAGKKPVVVDSLRKLLSLLATFDWKSCAEYFAESNRDNITLGPAPVTGDVSPVGVYDKPPADADMRKSYDETDAEWLEYIEKAEPDGEDPASLVDTYNRLCHVIRALPDSEGELLQQTRGAVASLAGALTTEPDPDPQAVKTYNEEAITKGAVDALDTYLEVEAVGGLDGYLETVEKAGGQVLRNFSQVDGGVGRVEADRLTPREPPAPLEGGVLKSFDQVAEPADLGAGDLGSVFQKLLEEVKKADGTVADKKALIKEIGDALVQKAQGEIVGAASEEERAGDWFQKAVVPVLEGLSERLDSLEGQLALALSGEREEPAQRAPLIRKSLDPAVRPSRAVTSKPTFGGLVRGDQYMDMEVGG